MTFPSVAAVAVLLIAEKLPALLYGFHLSYP